MVTIPPGAAKSLRRYKVTSPKVKKLQKLTPQATPKNIRAFQKAAGVGAGKGGGGGGGGGATKVAQTPQEMLISLFTNYQKGLMTPAQTENQIQRGIDAQIKASLAGAQAATKNEQYQALQQANRAAGFAAALGSTRKQEGEQVFSDYERAAQNIQGLGTGLTGAVQTEQQAAADRAAASLAEVSGGINTAGTDYDLAGLRNIAQYTGVVNPARDLYGEAANQAAGARLRNAAYEQSIQNVREDFLQEGTEAQQRLSAKRQELESTRPALYMAAVQAAQEGRRSDMATLVSAFALQNTVEQTQAGIQNDKLRTQIEAANAKAARAAAKAANAQDATKAYAANMAAQGFAPDGTLLPGFFFNKKSGRVEKIPGGTVIGPKGNPIDPTPSSGGGKPGGWDAQDTSVAIARVNKQLPSAKTPGIYSKITNSAVLEYGIPPKFKPSMSLAKAVAQLKTKYPKQIRNNPAVITAIKEALGQIGYKV